MAETRFDDEDTAEPGTVEAVEQEFEVDLAGLNENETEQVHEALTEAEFAGELDQVEIDEVIADAQQAEDNREEAEIVQRDQVEAREAGDYEGALDSARDVQENLNEANNQGADLDNAVQENAHDVEVLSEADFQQENAEDFTEASVDYAEAGSEDGADAAGDDAINAADSADAYADQSDADGGYGDQTIYTDNA